MSKIRVYCAGPFFNADQLRTMEQIESVVESFDINVFRPRNGAAAAKKLNKDIGAGKDPSADTRKQVFLDNVNNIDDSTIVVACIDDRDIGTIFEIGYAFKAGIPIITYTNKGFGMNLMLAESVVAHCKGEEQLRKAIAMYVKQVNDHGLTHVDWGEFDREFKRANLVESTDANRDMDLYKKGE